MFTQNDWSPLAWTLMFTGMVFFVVGLMGLLIFLVARAGRATGAPAADATRDQTGDQKSEYAEPRHLHVHPSTPAHDDTQAWPPADQPASRKHLRAG
ncbi:MAG TPA: hypothetical protein VGJ41_06355 [Nocardioides sp.]|jgi:hypothetical protein